MAVYFVLRTPYDSPSGKMIARYDDDNVNAWIRRNWEFGRLHPKEAEKIPDFGVYGYGIYGFALFFQAAEHASPPPEDLEELQEFLRDAIYSEGRCVFCDPHLITVLHNDDELEFVYYIFDDHYVREYPARAAFLLHQDWQLPTDAVEIPFQPSEPVRDYAPTGTGQGALYWACSAFEDSGSLSDLGSGLRIPGLRVPDLARYLARTDAAKLASGYWELLRARLFADGATSEPLEERFREALLDDPDDEATWAAYSDWLQERGFKPAGLTVLELALRSLGPYARAPDSAFTAVRTGTVREARAALDRVMAAHGVDPRDTHDPAKTLVRINEHVAEFCWHIACWEVTRNNQQVYHQWIFFDDQWAAAHPDLANSLLRYTRCWDMLSPAGPKDKA
jgi:uncharacterized protein (TIGR02996 family)